MTALLASARAEALRLRRWPALWVTLGIYLMLNGTFGYLFPYLSYRNGGGGFGSDSGSAEEQLAQVMPDAVPATLVQGMPFFGGALVLTLGGLAAGSGYGWGTWKTAFTQGPGRLASIGGALAVLAGAVVALVLASLALDMGTAWAIAAVEGRSASWPGTGDLAVAVGGGVLVLLTWMVAGFAVGTVARGPALAVGLGLVWVLVVETLLRGVAELLDWLRPIVDALPGSVVGSVAGAVGATPVSEGGTPGVLTSLSGPVAVGAAAAYVAGFAALTAVLVRRRDVA
jgi:hypothetical protein